jgi:hypothetical protein
MSQENVECAHRAYEAFNRRDLDALLALMDPEVRFTTRFVERSDPYDGHGWRPRVVGGPGKRSSENGSTGRPGGLLTRAAVQVGVRPVGCPDH